MSQGVQQRCEARRGAGDRLGLGDAYLLLCQELREIRSAEISAPQVVGLQGGSPPGTAHHALNGSLEPGLVAVADRSRSKRSKPVTDRSTDDTELPECGNAHAFDRLPRNHREASQLSGANEPLELAVAVYSHGESSAREPRGYFARAWEGLVLHELRCNTGCTGELPHRRVIRATDGATDPADGFRITPHGCQEVIEVAIRR